MTRGENDTQARPYVFLIMVFKMDSRDLPEFTIPAFPAWFLPLHLIPHLGTPD